MKRLLLTILALVAMTTGAWAQTYYGFTINGVPVYDDNYQSLGGDWSYDPVANVLHLSGQINITTAVGIVITGNANPTLNISVDGNCTLSGTFWTGIEISGSGTHVVSGTGTLNIESRVVGPTGINFVNNPSVTFKDLTVNIKQYGGVGVHAGDASITFDWCEFNITTNDGMAMRAANGTDSPQLILCQADHSWGNDASGSGYRAWADEEGLYASNVKITRCIKYVDVNVAKPVIGQLPATTATTSSSEFAITAIYWLRDESYPMSEGETFREGHTYKVTFRLEAQGDNHFGYTDVSNAAVVATINGQKCGFKASTQIDAIAYYTFPALSDTYDLWIAGTQVTKQNRDDILGDGKVTFDMNTSTLTLQNANISLSGNDGITSKVPDLKIKVLGQNSITIANSGRGVSINNDSGDGSVTFLGDGSLHVKSKGDAGIRSNIDVVLKDGVKIITESKQNSSIRGWKSTSSAPWPSLTMYGDKTILMAWKGLSSFHALNLNDGLSITRPAGATFVADQGVRVGSNSVQNEWVVIGDWVRGDANFDGVIDIADVTAVLTAMASNSDAPIYKVNDDDVVDIADVTAILTIMAGQ